jgi:RNA polymerase sigma factor (sigma-70 family)
MAGSARPPGPTLAELYREHYLGLVRLAMQLVDDQPSAEDLVQDVFARLQRRPVDFTDARRYLTTAVVNQARSTLRRRRVVRLHPVDADLRSGSADAAESADAAVLRDSASASIWRAISRLPMRQRQVVVLRYYVDWSIAEIAEALGISRGATSSSLDRALKSLAAPIGAIHAEH